MPHTPDQVQALRDEIQSWLKRNKLVRDSFWWKAEEYFGDTYDSQPIRYLLIFCSEVDLNDVMWREPLSKPGRSDRLRDEFDAIMDRNGFWFEFSENDIAGIYSDD